MYTKCYSAHVFGLDGQVIEVEVDISNGLPTFDIVGLPGSALKEAKERVRSAIRNSGFQFPLQRITVNLAPAHLRKEGSYFDMVIALALLIADHQVKLSSECEKGLRQTVFIGELALDGNTRGNQGVLPLVLAANQKGFQRVFVPEENFNEAKVVQGIQTVPIHSLTQAVELLESKQIESDQAQSQKMKVSERTYTGGEAFECIQGQEHVKRAFEIAACGRHHFFMIGPPGSGKTLLAKSFPRLLPPLSEKEAIEVTKIYSVAGMISNVTGLIHERPFRSPHHSITLTGMIGGGVPIQPGEITLAHLGVLFLDEFLEFNRSVNEALREPLEEGEITLTRGHYHDRFPAQFQLILALNPCPCGYYGYETAQHQCTCTASQIQRYRQRLSGPLFDRIDLHMDVPQMTFDPFSTPQSHPHSEYTTVNMLSRIQQGKKFQEERMKERAAITQNEPNSVDIERQNDLTPAARELLQITFQEMQFSARGYHKLIKIARTIADLQQSNDIDEYAMAEAIHYRCLDRWQHVSSIPR